MKFSQFNSYVNYEGRVVAYNAFNNQFMLLEPVLHDLLEAAKNEDNVKGLEEIHPDFYKALIEKGFIVEPDTDEVQKVKDLSKVVDSNDSHFLLIINPTMNCNFKCWYCYESHIKGSKMSVETIESLKKLIDTIVSDPRIKTFSISWFGGEPLLYYEEVIYPISEHAREVCDKYNVHLGADYTTNGYLVNEKRIEKFKEWKTHRLQITLDGNREKHNTVRYVSKSKGSYDEIIANVGLLTSSGLNVRLRINYTEETLKGIRDIVQDLEKFTDEQKKRIIVAFHQVWQDTADLTAQTNQIIKEFREKGLYVTTSENPDNVRNSCYADTKNHATINYNGDVFKCTARDFSAKNREGVLSEDGEIIWNEKYDKRMNAKFKNKPCLECKILPICNGGCTQHAMEHENDDYCIYGFDERKKEQVVYNKFLQTIEN
jgi:uncharacterized protein